jgi:hypothetical protein
MTACSLLREEARDDLLLEHPLGSRGTPGVKKKRALPTSSANPHAVPTGCDHLRGDRQHGLLLLFGGTTRLRRLKKLHPASHSSFRAARHPHLGRDFPGQVADRRAQPPFSTMTASIPAASQRAAGLPVVTHRRFPPDREADVSSLWLM